MEILQLSSLLFTIIIYKAFLENHLLMGFVFYILTLTSFFYHGTNNSSKLFLLDQISIYIVILTGFLYTLNANLKFKIIMFVILLSVILLYILQKKLEFENEEKDIYILTDKIHVLVHIMVVFGFTLMIEFVKFRI